MRDSGIQTSLLDAQGTKCDIVEYSLFFLSEHNFIQCFENQSKLGSNSKQRLRNALGNAVRLKVGAGIDRNLRGFQTHY